MYHEKGVIKKMERTNFFPKEYVYNANIENITLSLIIIRPANCQNTESAVYQKVMHSHSYHELFICMKGNVFIKTENGLVHLQEKDICIVPSNLLHIKLPTEKNVELVGIGISFVQRHVKDAANLYKIFQDFFVQEDIILLHQQPQLYNQLAEILNNISNQENYLPALKLAVLLSDIINSNLVATSGQNGNKFLDDNNRQRKLDHLINVHFSKNLTSADIAKDLFISVRQLDRIVQKRYGTTLRNVINDKRMLVACQMLLETEMSVDNIGTAVGFCSRSSFYREFKKKYHMTPAEYRKVIY